MTEETNLWHPLPMLVGNALTSERYGVPMRCGEYTVVKDRGQIRIGRAVDTYEMIQDVPDDADFVTFDDLIDRWEVCDLIGVIKEPDGGWGDECNAIRASIFEGYR